MQRYRMRFALFALALAFAPAAHAQTLSDLAWLKGCWRTSGDDPRITEVWVAPPGPAMFGYSYTEDGGAIATWEQTRIEVIDGVPHFIAMPNGGAPVRFRMTDTDILLRDGVSFVNAEHDFPQIVSYARDGNRLTAQISDVHREHRITFEYRRIACTAELRP